MIILLGFAFLSGLVTILAPCIWPVLPIVLSSSVAGHGGHQRPLGITLGVMLSFTIFTLSVSYIVRIFHLDPNVLRLFAVVIIGFLGLTMLIPALATRFELLVSKLSNIFGQNNSQKQGSGFLPGFVTGLSLGIVWSPCAGPILATIATLAATGQVTISVILVTVAYVVGVGVPLFAFAYGGQQFITRARGINKYTGRIQQAFGVVMIAAAIAILTNYDKTLQLQVLNAFPQLGTVVNGFENSSTVKDQLNVLSGKKSTNSNSTIAPEFTGISTWLNTDNKPLSLASLKGKVVLVDFWTYTCINCVRTLPHITSWYEKYKAQGFVVVGVHTPEFQFEHDTGNVKNAIKQFNITYPVAQDNEYATWNAYNNQYWPAEYLIDAQGIIRDTHFGEGEYDKTELEIQKLLKENGQTVSSGLSSIPDQTPNADISPETYLGSQRMLYLATIGKATNGAQAFQLEPAVTNNHFSFGGRWNISGQYTTSLENATLIYNFTAGKVFIVMRPGTTKDAQVRVMLDGKVITPAQSGKDVVNGIVTVDKDRLYDLVNLHGNVENHVLQLEFPTPGVELYAFTFGS